MVGCPGRVQPIFNGSPYLGNAKAAKLQSYCWYSNPFQARRAMRPRVPQIVALGGGGFSMEQGNPLLDDYVLSLTGTARPRVCFLPTASGDADHYVVRFYRAFPASRCEPSHISLFRRETGVGDPRAHLLDQDLIYVGGGSLV